MGYGLKGSSWPTLAGLEGLAGGVDDVVKLKKPDCNDDVAERLLPRSLSGAKAGRFSSTAEFWSAIFLAIVLFLAAALAFAAWIRTAFLVSLLTPEELLTSKGTKATVDLLFMGSGFSSEGEVSGLREVDLRRCSWDF